MIDQFIDKVYIKTKETDQKTKQKTEKEKSKSLVKDVPLFTHKPTKRQRVEEVYDLISEDFWHALLESLDKEISFMTKTFGPITNINEETGPMLVNNLSDMTNQFMQNWRGHRYMMVTIQMTMTQGISRS